MATNYLKPKEGYAWNPLRNWPRNSPCVCGSGEKFKKCHGPNMPICCKAEDEAKLLSLVRAVKEGRPVRVQIQQAPKVEAVVDA